MLTQKHRQNNPPFDLENQDAFSDGVQKVICFKNTSVFCFYIDQI